MSYPFSTKALREEARQGAPAVDIPQAVMTKKEES